jgi:LysR family transcriptional regulator, glycine cleavage system transcriptional activator
MKSLHSALPPLTALRPFEAAVRLGSFKAAADELHLTPSAISHQINSLECHFRTKLFIRQGNRLVLTKAGSTYGAAIAKILSELSEASVIFRDRTSQRVLRVSVSPAFAMFGALPYIEAFKLRNRSLDLRIESKNTNVDFDVDVVDAAIQVGGAPTSDLRSHRLFESRFRPVAHRALCERFGPIRRATDLARMPLIELNSGPRLWDLWFAKVGGSVKLQEARLACDSLLSAIQMAKAGVGVFLAPFPLLISLIADKRLKVLSEVPLIVDYPDLYLVNRFADNSSPKIEALRAWLDFVSADMETKAQSIGL